MTLHDNLHKLYGHSTKNLTHFAMSRPPLVVFFLFIGILCISLVSLAYFIDNNAITDYEASQEWNKFVDHVSNIDFCFTNFTKKLNHSEVHEKVHHSNTAHYINISIPLPLKIWRGTNISSLPNHVSQMTAFVQAHQVGLSDDFHKSIVVSGHLNTFWKPATVSETEVHVCVTFSVEHGSLPSARPYMSCEPRPSNNTSQNMIHMDAFKRKVKQNEDEPACSKFDARMRFRSEEFKKNNPVLLTLLDRSKITFRLHIASYFFFVLLLSAVLYIAIRRRSKNKHGAMKILHT